MEDIKILIVEDEILIAEDLKDTLSALGFGKIEMAHDKATALKMLETYGPQVTLLDIRLENETDGLQIGEFMSKNKIGQFIYVTAHSDVEMVRQIIKTNPSGYITKPVKKSDLYAGVMLAIEQAKNREVKNQAIRIKDGYETVMLDVNRIKYIEAEGNYLTLFCEDKKYVIRQAMDAFLQEANCRQLYKIHRSYAVNIQKVIRFSKKEIQLTGDETLPLSRTVKDDFELFMKSSVK